MGHREAHEALNRARKFWERVSLAAWAPEDHEAAVMWAFYAYESCIVAAAEARSITWTPVHWHKVALARELHRDGVVSRDVGDELERLNALRKDVQYGDPGLELLEVDLEGLTTELETFIEEIAELIDPLGDQ